MCSENEIRKQKARTGQRYELEKKNERDNKGRTTNRGTEEEGKERNRYEIVGQQGLQSEKNVEFSRSENDGLYYCLPKGYLYGRDLKSSLLTFYLESYFESGFVMLFFFLQILVSNSFAFQEYIIVM